MAKRRRLIPPSEPVDWSARARAPEAPALTLGTPPIASVAGDASAAAALAEVSGALTAARDEGRLIQRLALSEVDETHLVRDRLAFDGEAMQSLTESLRARGQQTPIEVVELGPGHYGLISGWRRLTALKQLLEETGEDRFASVLAILRRPEEASDSYVAMVEENEIRVGLSYYERARIVVHAVQEGVYPTQKAALQSLFAAASRTKRSKIKSFIPIVETLDGVLRWPTGMGERLGLRLGKALSETADLGAVLAEGLRAAAPGTAEAEQRLIAGLLTPPRTGDADPPVPPAARAVTVSFQPETGQVTLAGPGVNAALVAALEDWLTRRP